MKPKKKPKPAAYAKSRTKAKPNPAPETSAQSHKELIVKAAMDIAADKGWPAVSSAALARRVKLAREYVAEIFPDKHDLLRALSGQVDEQMISGGPAEGELRDRLFEIFMRRFDALMPYRAGVKAVAQSVADEPVLLLALLGSFGRSAGAILELAGLEASLPRQMGLGVLMLDVLRSWLADDSADLGATMAALDRRLGQLEQLAGVLAPLGRGAVKN